MAAPSIPNPILKALSLMRQNGVNCLVMGGQACAFYGAAEFSRDLDLVIAAESASMALLTKALTALKATLIAVPEFELRDLGGGHAVHFRCQDEGAAGLRIDVMSKLRELRTASILCEMAIRYPQSAALLMPRRPCLAAAIDGDTAELRRLLRNEEEAERAADELYWKPLELEAARRNRKRSEL